MTPPEDKEITPAKENVPAVLLCDRGLEKHLLRLLPAGDLIHPLESKTRTPPQDDGQLIGSVKGGWLIHYKTHFRPEVIVSGYEDQFLCYNYVSFHDPVSGARLNLPPEPNFIPREDFLPRFIANVVTSDSLPDSPEFIAVAFFLNSNRHWLAFCKIEDESWTHISDITHAQIAGVVVQLALTLDDRKRVLYFVHINSSSSNYDVMAFDIKDSKKITRRRIVMADHPDKVVPREGTVTRKVDKSGQLTLNLKNAEERVFLVADSLSGELFMIFQTNDIAVLPAGMNYDLLPIKSYRIFKLEDNDNCVESGGRARWKEIDDLGDRSICIGYLGSRVIYTDRLNVGSKSEDFLRENCIYFALQTTYVNQASMRRDIGIFSLKEKSIRHFNVHPLFQQQPSATLWFSPK